MEYINYAQELLEILMRFKKIMRHAHHFEELNFSEMMVCGFLAHKEQEHMQMKDISDIMKISRPALNSIVNKLEYKDLVERYRIDGDRKSVYLRFSDKSKMTYNREYDALIQVMNTIVSKMGIEDTVQLIALLSKFYDITKQEVDKIC